MKKIILALVAIMTMSAAQAQDNQSEKKGNRRFDKTEMVKQRTERTAKQYGLNEEQTAKLLELNTKYADKMGPGMGRNGGRGMRQRPQAKGDNAQAGEQQNKRPEMTEEQKQKMQQMRQEREEAMKQYDTELQAIMTADQFKAYKADAEKMRNRSGRGGKRTDKTQQ